MKKNTIDTLTHDIARNKMVVIKQHNDPACVLYSIVQPIEKELPRLNAEFNSIIKQFGKEAKNEKV